MRRFTPNIATLTAKIYIGKGLDAGATSGGIASWIHVCKAELISIELDGNLSRFRKLKSIEVSTTEANKWGDISRFKRTIEHGVFRKLRDKPPTMFGWTVFRISNC